MTNYYRTLYISSFKVPYAAIYPPETVDDLRWVTAPPQPVRPPLRLTPQLMTFSRIEILIDPLGHSSWMSQPLQPQRRQAFQQSIVAGPILEPSLLIALTAKPFSASPQPIQPHKRGASPIYDNGSDLGAWYSAPTILGLFSASPQPVRQPPRVLHVDQRTPIVPDLIFKPFVSQAPETPQRLALRLVPQAAFNINVPTITLDAVVCDFTPTDFPRAKPRGPWPHANVPIAQERFIVTLDKWRSESPQPVRLPRLTPQGGNFAPPIYPTFDVFSWWAPSPLPARQRQGLVPTTFFNLGLPLPGDASTVSQVDWFKPIVVRPPARVPWTQSTQPSFQAYDLTVASWCMASPQPVRRPSSFRVDSTSVPIATEVRDNLRWLTPSPQPMRPVPRMPAEPSPFVRVIVALDFPQLTVQPILRRPAAVPIVTPFCPPAVFDSAPQRFAPSPQPVRLPFRAPSIDPVGNPDPSLFVVPVPISWQQPTVPLRPPHRVPWCSPSAFIFRPVAATDGLVHEGEVFTPHLHASEVTTPGAVHKGQVFTPFVDAGEVS